MIDYQTIAVIIPAAGYGKRMKLSVPKQFIQVGGKSVLAHTVDKFHCWAKTYGRHIVIMVALSEMAELPKDVTNVVTCLGGKERANSVSNAMEALHQVLQFDWVMVHDAARPLVRVNEIEKLYQALKEDEVGGLLAQKVTATVKRVEKGKVVETIPRDSLYLAQTPQLFRFDLLRRALGGDCAHFTDEAAGIEAMGLQPKVVEGSADNIKISTASDLAYFERLVRVQA